MRKLFFILLFISQLSYSQDMINWWSQDEAISLPTVVLNFAVQGDNYCQGDFSGEVTSDGGGSVTERGFVHSTSPNPDINDNKVIVGSGIGTFGTLISSWSAAQAQYINAYAINSVGVSYGTETSVVTNLKPSTTASAGSITSNSAIVSGSVTTNDNDVTDVKVWWGTSPGIYSDSKLYGSGGGGAYSVDLTSLLPSTTYYYRVNPITSACLFKYTTEQSFVTLSGSPPTYDDGFKATGLSIDCPGGTSSPLDNDILVDAIGAFCFANNYSGNAYKTVVIVSFNGDYDGDGNTVFTTDASGSFSIENIDPGDSSGKKLTFSDPDGYFCSEDQSCALYYYIIDINDVSGPTKKVEWVVQNL